ncbi:hypothetical protein Bsp3421_000101 (plasmid) [Burkholderia sp. FERM BP-3421]|uniref:hypothetical protein n=1 Tax=Burkholderia sp. FERM BP-3421 TaxID=1494466 RepID=UPI002361904A|nr:hypothetical protein [Burkholderia sp. FERM BP-3421]WDD90278.1 hypothetical protein Bsp3421_000101 [Burkholderia sp. FERM BP-3421]
MVSYAETARQLAALSATYKYLLNQQPSDPVAMAQVNQDIVAMCDRLNGIGFGSTATDSQLAIDNLNQAIGVLNNLIICSASATSIVNGVAAVMAL